MSDAGVAEAVRLQRQFFEIIETFFTRATGSTVHDFGAVDDFGQRIKQDPRRLAAGLLEARAETEPVLRRHYAENAAAVFAAAKNLPGLKLVLGGGGRFAGAQLRSVQKTLLYADTILVPDPVSPWLEVERPEEKFPHVHFLRSIFTLLQLKPLVDADLPYPAVVVFPSLEKLLEAHDGQTKAGTEQFIAGVIGFHIGVECDSRAGFFQWVRANEQDFLRRVAKGRLFVAPGGYPGQSLDAAVAQYKQYILTQRTSQYVASLRETSDAELVLIGIAERVNPHYHLMENADELGSHPLVSIEAHWHSFQLCSEYFSARLLRQGTLQQEVLASMRAMNSPDFAWLANVPVEALVQLRQDGENEDFRRELAAHIAHLDDTSLNDINKVAGEVSRAITSLQRKHIRRVQGIQAKYSKRYAGLAAGAAMGIAAALCPVLAPFVGMAAPLTLGGAYIVSKCEERGEKKAAGRSLMGVLAVAKEAADQKRGVSL